MTVGNKTYFGVNSTITKESHKATRELRQKWLREVEWVPPKKNNPKHLGHVQSHSLIRAFEKQGSLPGKVTMYVDRKTCNICRGELPALLKRLGVDELEVFSGGHNYDEFKNYFNSNSNKYELGPVVKNEHPDIDGVFDIEYKVKYEKMDYTGKNGTGEYKVIPNGDKVYKKTVYDPKIISNDEIIDLSKKAMEEGLNNKREIPLLKQKKIKIQGQTDYNGKNSKFEGIMNSETGEIENAYPVLEWVD
ncbi:hypothetical protein COL91_03460 [Bacillus pseudomycoides]|nr:hypothetical protein COO02_13615 [Bacillus pseudomycoides]PEI86615.1 hypothetical protein CN679_23245 [Bacillus pseudomycoides]PGA93854.1 hypothetical protein COL91_03460 [Bacillus pseudomycoides]PHF49187.1 hypothetical protein COF72_08580 [Bacillus pseudomycoides]